MRILPHLCVNDLDAHERQYIESIARTEFNRWLSDHLAQLDCPLQEAFINLLADYARANHELGDGSTFYGHMVNCIDMLFNDDKFVTNLRAELEEKGQES